MTRDAKYSIGAFIGGIVVGAVLIALELAGVDLAGVYRKWFGLVLWTALMFGLLGWQYGRRLRKAKALALFLAMLALHVSVLTLYLRSADRFPNLFFLFFAPFEGGIVAFVLSVLGGVSLRGADAAERPRDEK
jgi:hypothetical protein